MRLWKRQILAVVRIDLAKTFLSKRGLWIYLLALAPLLPMFGHWIFASGENRNHPLGEDVQIFAGIFQFYYLRVAIFFGCAGIFMNLFRGEMLDKSLHYYMLAPARREVLLVGKFVSGMTAAMAIFCAGVLLAWIAVFMHFPSELLRSFMFSGPGMNQLMSYLVAAALACLGYGSLFLWAGVRYRNPLAPAAILLVWESIDGILPSMLKKVSVIYWLKSLCPVAIPTGKNNGAGIWNLLVFDIDPAPAGVAALNLLLLAGFVLVWAAMRARRLEISYSSD